MNWIVWIVHGRFWFYADTAPLAKEKKKLTLRHEWPEKTEDAFSTRKMKKTDI
jgi:hypothetical protein